MIKSWVTKPTIPGIYKIQVFKDTRATHRFPWVLIMPTKDRKTRSMQRYMDWHTAFQTALTLQDIANRNSP